MKRLKSWVYVLLAVFMLTSSLAFTVSTVAAQTTLTSDERIDVKNFILDTIDGYNNADVQAVERLSDDFRSRIFWGQTPEEIVGNLENGELHPIELISFFDVFKVGDNAYAVGVTYSGVWSPHQIDSFYWIIERDLKVFSVTTAWYIPDGSIELGFSQFSYIDMEATEEDIVNVYIDEGVEPDVPVVIGFNNRSAFNIVVSVYKIDDSLIQQSSMPEASELQELILSGSPLLEEYAITTFGAGFPEDVPEMAFYGSAGCFFIQFSVHGDMNDHDDREMVPEIYSSYCTS